MTPDHESDRQSHDEIAAFMTVSTNCRSLTDKVGQGRELECPLFFTNQSVTIPEGNYYIEDAGLGLTRQVITPFHGTCYHPKEWERSRKKPLTPNELYNLRHSQCQNVIKRKFGNVKKRFPKLQLMHEFSAKTQARLGFTLVGSSFEN
jgi:hypothetical protein